jgi:hypothetical protein
MMVGGYELHLYCSNTTITDIQSRAGCYHAYHHNECWEYTGETAGETRGKARGYGWKLDLTNDRHYCPNCNGKKADTHVSS